MYSKVGQIWKHCHGTVMLNWKKRVNKHSPSLSRHPVTLQQTFQVWESKIELWESSFEGLSTYRWLVLCCIIILHHSTVVCLVAWPLNEREAQVAPGLTASLSIKGLVTKHPTGELSIRMLQYGTVSLKFILQICIYTHINYS